MISAQHNPSNSTENCQENLEEPYKLSGAARSNTQAAQLNLSFAGKSTAGVKPVNQDAFAAHLPTGHAAQHKGGVAVIADGLSCSDSSEIASQIAVTSFSSDYSSTPDTWSVKKSVERVLSALNAWLYNQGYPSANTANHLVSTFSALIIKSNTAHVFHIGDCRIHHIRGQNIETITRDHVTQIGSQKHLSRALGIDHRLDVDYSTLLVEENDLFLLTSDGVHDWLNLTSINDIVTDHTLSLQARAERLIEYAETNGSDDNLTAVLIQINQLPLENEQEALDKLTQLPFPPLMESGMSLDGYRIITELYASERSQLYLAKDPLTDKRVVIKTPSPNYRDDPIYIDAFVREEWIGRRINHRHIMQVYTPHRAKRCLYLVAEYIEGQSLEQWMVDNPNPDLKTVRRIVNQIVLALRAFHRMDMIHQDLKPANIMISEDLHVTLIDFGATKVMGIAEQYSPIDREMPLGSYNYTAPEFLLGERPTFRADLFSLAVITYEILTGELPFEPLSKYRTGKKNVKQLVYRPLNQSKRKDLPGWIDQTLQRGCAPRAQERYSSLSEFLQDLHTPNPQYSEVSRPLSERDPVRFWQGISGLLLLLVLFLICW